MLIVRNVLVAILAAGVAKPLHGESATDQNQTLWIDELGPASSQDFSDTNRYDSMTAVPAEIKSRAMPSMMTIARQIRMQFDMPLNLRRYLSGSSASLLLRFGDQGDFSPSNILGNPYLRSILYEKLLEMKDDPILTEAFHHLPSPEIRIVTRVLKPQTDGHHCLLGSQEDFSVDGFQITFWFRPPCTPDSLAWHLVSAQKEEDSVMLGLNVFAFFSIPSELKQRRIDEQQLHERLREIRKSPAFR